MIYIGSRVQIIDPHCNTYQNIGEVVAIATGLYSIVVSFPPDPEKYPPNTIGATQAWESSFMPCQLEAVEDERCMNSL